MMRGHWSERGNPFIRIGTGRLHAGCHLDARPSKRFQCARYVFQGRGTHPV